MLAKYKEWRLGGRWGAILGSIWAGMHRAVPDRSSIAGSSPDVANRLAGVCS